MFLNFFFALRKNGIPVSLHEYLALMEALQKDIGTHGIDEFYALSKAVLVKQEGHLDRFDLLFGQYFRNVNDIGEALLQAQIPDEWLRANWLNNLTDEEKAQIEKLGGLDALMERLKTLMEEQKKNHNGGNRWIGTGGSSPFGSGGYNPEGMRMGNQSAGNRTGLKVWEKRAFKNLDDRVELNTRNIKLILKRLRILTREGIPNELDLDGTIRKTSENAGMLDIAMHPAKKNRVKVLLLLDIGGSMDEHISLCEQLFSAAKWEFKQLEFFYFHNCVYEYVWKDNHRRFHERIPTLELLHKYNGDYKLIFVGDAAMSTYEIFYRGGSVEHHNDEPGITWLRRLENHFRHIAWINPLPEYEWDYYESVKAIRTFTGNRMFPMTVEGLTQAMRSLKNSKYKYTNEVWGNE
jgi:uncharacterized protein with von Willebrand factor type A (vWA) domain